MEKLNIFQVKWTLETFTFSLLYLNDEIKADGRSESDAVLSVCIFVHSTSGMHLRENKAFHLPVF
jgi:hypothetical protein